MKRLALCGGEPSERLRTLAIGLAPRLLLGRRRARSLRRGRVDMAIRQDPRDLDEEGEV